MSSERKHTPGPWTQWVEHASVYAGDVRVNKPWTIGGRNESFARIAECDPSNLDHLDKDEAEEQAMANARLIAAAPDLLEALEALADSAETLSGHDENDIVALTRARAAIAKATGEASHA